MPLQTETNNPNNNYTVTIATDTTGGDSTPTSSGYEENYLLEITPKAGKTIIAGNFKINGIISDATAHASLHGIVANHAHPSLDPLIAPSGSTTDSKMAYMFMFSQYASTPSFIFSHALLTEVYLDDNGNEWYYGLNGSQQPTTSVSNTDPIKLRLELFLKSTFTSTVPTISLTVELDIDEDILTPIYGCTDPTAFNYDPTANTDNGTCIPVIAGCTDPAAANYYAGANVDDGTCIYPIQGCTDNTNLNSSGGLAALNFDPNATQDDGSCVYECHKSILYLANITEWLSIGGAQPTFGSSGGLVIRFQESTTTPKEPNIVYTLTAPDGSVIGQPNTDIGIPTSFPVSIPAIIFTDFVNQTAPMGTYTLTTNFTYPNANPAIPSCSDVYTTNIFL